MKQKVDKMETTKKNLNYNDIETKIKLETTIKWKPRKNDFKQFEMYAVSTFLSNRFRVESGS